MKILIIHHIAMMHGSSISMFSMVEGILSKGIEVCIAIPDNMPFEDAFLNRTSQLGLKLYKIHLVQSTDATGWSRNLFPFKCFLRRWKNLLKDKLNSYYQICSIIEIEHPDIIHTNVGVIHEGFWAARMYNLPHVFHLREYQDLDFGWRILPTKRLFEFILLKSSAVCPITEGIQEHFNLKDNKNSFVVYNGIYSKQDIAFDSNKENYFLLASRVSQEKGIEEIINAFSIFVQTHTNWKLKIAGSATEQYLLYLTELVNHLGCNSSIEFLGHVSNVKELMQKAKALIVGSYNEGFGRMTAEAAFNGCLIIGRNTAGTKEIMDRIGGFPFLSQSELIQRMHFVSILSNEEYMTNAKESQSKAIELYSIEQNVDKMISIYRSLIIK